MRHLANINVTEGAVNGVTDNIGEVSLACDLLELVVLVAEDLCQRPGAVSSFSLILIVGFDNISTT